MLAEVHGPAPVEAWAGARCCRGCAVGTVRVARAGASAAPAAPMLRSRPQLLMLLAGGWLASEVLALAGQHAQRHGSRRPAHDEWLSRQRQGQWWSAEARCDAEARARAKATRGPRPLDRHMESGSLERWCSGPTSWAAGWTVKVACVALPLHQTA